MARATTRAKVDALLRLVEAHGRRNIAAATAAATAATTIAYQRQQQQQRDHASPRAAPKTHVVAFSGGVDSSLTAAIVHRVFPDSAVACLGVSPSLSEQQLEQARDVARQLRVPLWECRTTESENAQYIANRGESCYHCKTNLYSTITQVAAYASEQLRGSSDDLSARSPTIYNGTNADDKLDPTRLGLVAAGEFDVVSPLSHLTKREVREVAKYLGLPNWIYAASPCLRSRLAFGIEATERHLKRVEEAEDFVRRAVDLEPAHNMRVRFLAGNRAAVELDTSLLARAQRETAAIDAELRRLGFDAVELRAFRSGSLSGFVPIDPSHHPHESL